MFKQSLAVAVLALAAAAPANAASLPTALGGLMSFSRDAARVYVFPTGTALIPPLRRFEVLKPVALGTPPGQPFPPLPGLSALSGAGAQGTAALTKLVVLVPRRR